MSITKIVVAAVAVAVGCLGQAQATPPSFEHHVQLMDAVKATGIALDINPFECTDGVEGFYTPTSKRLAICQDNAKQQDEEVSWTLDDFDTLRHEAHHLVQGCMVGDNFDNKLGFVYRDPKTLVLNNLGYKQAMSVIRLYQRAGFSGVIIGLELEAAAVAAMNNPLEQVQDINRFCF